MGQKKSRRTDKQKTAQRTRTKNNKIKRIKKEMLVAGSEHKNKLGDVLNKLILN